MSAEGKSDFSMLVVFAIGLGIGWTACLFVIPNTEHYKVELQAMKNDVHELKMSLAASRNRIEAQDFHLKWHDSRLDNHSKRHAIASCRKTTARAF